eukprot:CAMPEP_0116131152 /NCGR_PEP_ID=MMETSP0329-20121206/8854_1 /TAXON_ID=697910 /ORGANISM="Pseudo-nitzschia arenysensis, Strain B593" /LENGTH=353 /DNA_ID=CAMNT_0003625565 /DNA_START=177 /DNA_END=1234 /DNA_ORIENTATION=+
MMLSKVSRSAVACNVYISAGGHANHRDMLLGLLGETQELCRRANNNKNVESAESDASNERVVVVHAFRDGPYDRSSFHLAGSPDMVADVGSSLAVRAVQELIRFETTSNAVNDAADSNETKEAGKRHPTVGLVDHVSVLPLDDETINSEKNEITGSVARAIGKSLESSGADVLYYGDAHPSGKELAAVRRDSTKFFEDSNNHKNTAETIISKAGQATVGAPHRFVENFNIRLKPGVSRTIARTLTESVRERSGKGLPFVEALTLAYGRDQYEVACNLLDPSVTSSGDIEDRMNSWEEEQRRQEGSETSNLVETAYRVGTTTDMCLRALQEVSTKEGELTHNKRVFERLQGYFL